MNDTKNMFEADSVVAQYVKALLRSPLYGSQVTCHRLIAGKDAVYGQLRHPLPKAVADILAARGIPGLYAHQTAAIDAVRSGRDVIVATPTASGKSLIYTLPILERLLLDPEARALMLFPLKALAQDQLASFNALTAGWPEAARPSAAIYDGDSGDSARRQIRKLLPSVLITNPEMLHLALLPYHTQWTTLFASLTHVVVDEVHMYRGVLGSHMVQVFRRLKRICARYGARPTFVLCSATVGNPGELASRLLDLPGQDGPGTKSGSPLVVTTSGASAGNRHMVFINPQDSPSTMAIVLLQEALARGLRTIVYCRSRRMTELIAIWAAGKGADKGRISAYRAGFLPEERREIEARLNSGDLDAVVTTSALELGIDIGTLDVCILVGYPGTIMSTLQRGGRVGRSGQESAVFLIAGEDALDQYFMRHPESFFARGAESAVINPDNEVVIRRHLECAAAELPLRNDEPWLHTPGGQRALLALQQEGLLLQSADGNLWHAARKRPHRLVNLRGSGSVHVVEDEHGNPIGSMDIVQAMHEAYPGAVYLHHGKSYLVRELDLAGQRIRTLSRQVAWFTRARSHKITEILSVAGTCLTHGAAAAWGRLRVTETISGYEKRSTGANRLLSVNSLDLPPLVFETEGLWIIVPDPVRQACEEALLHFMGGIHAMEHAMIGLMPLVVMADRNDFGGISIPMHPQLGAPAIFVYDGLPGGAGLSRTAFARISELLVAVEQTVRNCPCETGCPSCVHSPKCGSGNRPIAKDACLFLLDRILRPDTATLERARKDEDYVRNMPVPEEMPRDEMFGRHLGTYGDPMEHPGIDTGILPAQPMNREEKPAVADNSMPSAGQAMSAGPKNVSPCMPAAAIPSRFMVLDVETRRSADEVGGWHRAAQMGVSVAVLYDSREDACFSYRQEMLDMPGGLFDRLRETDLVVGFNILRFDYHVLQPFAGYALRQLPTLDLLQAVKERLAYRVSLDNIARATLGSSKNGHGLQALEWWRAGRMEELADYCRQDVLLTRDLYLYGRKRGYVLFTNKAGNVVRIPVSW